MCVGSCWCFVQSDVSGKRRDNAQLLRALPSPAAAITQPIGQGVPSAKAPTSAELATPAPYWAAPTRAETAPARSGRRASALVIELAAINPVADANAKSGSTRP